MSTRIGMRQRALRQAGLLALLAALVATAALAVRAPAGSSALHAEVGVLRSQAAEVHLLAREARSVPARFLHAQAEQAERNIERERDRIAGMRVLRSLESSKAAALRAANVLASALRALRDGANAAPADVPREVRGELESLERSLGAPGLDR